jgi:predicted ATP-dependent endonuclease of OLD family
MKLVFNPKVVSGKLDENTVYLLDEPGSYLHQAAQEKLCKKLSDISKKHGNVIYCTHSHKLLNPDLVPFNSIYIVGKDKQKRIRVSPLPTAPTNAENIDARQPVFEALQIPALDVTADATKIIAVEGIFDRYAIQLMLTLENNTYVLPGTGASSVVKNIQYLNAYNKQYIAIWDNDDEGIKQRKAATDFFGIHEAKRFDLLPSKPSAKRRMEETRRYRDSWGRCRTSAEKQL